MKIIQIRYALDNFSYLLHGEHFAGVIDGGAVEEILGILESEKLELQFVVRSTLQDEYKVNRFLRFNHRKIISILEGRGLPVGTEYQRWESLWKTKEA